LRARLGTGHLSEHGEDHVVAEGEPRVWEPDRAVEVQHEDLHRAPFYDPVYNRRLVLRPGIQPAPRSTTRYTTDGGWGRKQLKGCRASEEGGEAWDTGGTRRAGRDQRVQLVRRDGREVSNLYGREGGGGRDQRRHSEGDSE